MIFRMGCLGLGVILLAASTWAHGGGHGGGGPIPPPMNPPPAAPPTGNPAPPGVTTGPRPASVTPPTAPSGPTPKTPGPVGPKTGGGIWVEEIDTWQRWWRYNQHQFLQLRSAIYDLGLVSGDQRAAPVANPYRPTEQEIQEKIVPALLSLLREDQNPHLNSAILVALAKIGRHPKLSPEIARHLADPKNQEMAETAAFCLGLLQDPRTVPTLVAIAQDHPEGRSFVGKDRIPYRTRAFAIYGLAWFGSESKNPKLRRELVEEIRKISLDESTEIGAACVTALGLIRDEDRSAVEPLRRLLENSELDVLVRSQLPIALSRLLQISEVKEAAHPLRSLVCQRLLACIEDRREKDQVRASAIQALPGFFEQGTSDAKSILEVLERALKDARNQTEKHFAVIALGKIATAESEQILMRHVSKAKTLKPWLALAMGIHAFRNPSAKERFVGVVRDLFDTEGNPANLGAYALALGLMRDKDSESRLQEKLQKSSQEELQGFCALGLGLMDARQSVPFLQKLALGSLRKPDLLKQSSIALVLLGDKSIALELVQEMEKAKVLALQTALGQAIGWVGDRRCLDPLLKLLDGNQVTPLGKAFVVIGLGMIVHREPLHWSARFATDLNYLSSPSCLFDSASFGGIIDIM